MKKLFFLMFLVVISGFSVGCASTDRWGSYRSEESSYNSWGGRYQRNSISYNDHFRPPIGGLDISFHSTRTKKTHGTWTFNGITQVQRNSVFDPVQCYSCGGYHESKGCYSETVKSEHWIETSPGKSPNTTIVVVDGESESGHSRPTHSQPECPCGHPH